MGIDLILRVKDGRLSIARASASGGIYSADPYNYLSFADDATPAAMAALLGTSGLSGIAGAGVMI